MTTKPKPKPKPKSKPKAGERVKRSSSSLFAYPIKQEEEESAAGGFFGCYLLSSLCPRFKDHTYIGFTINPRRRIRQHNGEITSGAGSTMSKRPWEMILCIYGFPTKISALRFEWAWQNPTESLAVREAAVGLKSLSGIAGKIMLAYTMLTLSPWQRLKLTVNFFSTKHMNSAAGCPSLPKQMKVQFCPMDELPCYTDGLLFTEMDDLNDEANDADPTSEDEDAKYGPADVAVYSMSDYYDDMGMTVDDILKWEENDIFSDTGDLFSQSEKNQPNESLSSYEEKLIVEQPYYSVDSPGGTAFRDTDMDLSPPSKSPQAPLFKGNYKPSPSNSNIASHKIEVIDILSPSPKSIICSFRRQKRRNNWVSQETIDLTSSPNFIKS